MRSQVLSGKSLAQLRLELPGSAVGFHPIVEPELKISSYASFRVWTTTQLEYDAGQRRPSGVVWIGSELNSEVT